MVARAEIGGLPYEADVVSIFCASCYFVSPYSYD